MGRPKQERTKQNIRRNKGVIVSHYVKELIEENWLSVLIEKGIIRISKKETDKILL